MPRGVVNLTESHLVDVVLQVTCPSCWAGTGVHCKFDDLPTEAGVRVHNSRLTPIMVSYRVGFREGYVTRREQEKVPARKYSVTTTYCNEYSHTHEHERPSEAVDEYASMIRRALEPDPPPAKHVRQVVLLAEGAEIAMGDKLSSWSVNTGVFPCEHRLDH